MLANRPASHVIISDGARIAGYVRFGAIPYAPDRYAGQTLGSMLTADFVIAREGDIFNSIATRMSTRHRTFAIVVGDSAGVPRAENVVGVIDAPKSPMQ